MGKSVATGALTAAERWDSLFKKYASYYGLDWKMLKAIAMNESSLGTHPSVAWGLEHPDDVEGSKSDDGKSWGLMQVTVTTARDWDSGATSEKLNNPEYSIRIASQLLSWLMKQFPTSEARYTEWVVKAYNQGRGNSSKERAGTGGGYANEYWARYQRNYARLGDE